MGPATLQQLKFDCLILNINGKAELQLAGSASWELASDSTQILGCCAARSSRCAWLLLMLECCCCDSGVEAAAVVLHGSFWGLNKGSK